MGMGADGGGMVGERDLRKVRPYMVLVPPFLDLPSSLSRGPHLSKTLPREGGRDGQIWRRKFGEMDCSEAAVLERVECANYH